MELTSWPIASGIFISFLIIAALFKATSANHNHHIRRVAFFCLSFLLSVALTYLFNHLLWQKAAVIVFNIASLFGWLTLVELFSIMVFKLLLPKLGYQPPSIISELFLGALVIILIISTLRNFGVDTTGIVATSAVVTAILAISLQATLGNVIGGIALQLDRSIRVGDWIQLENGQQGKVQEIRWRHTVIETRDWDSIIVPNASLLAANIIILGKREGESIQHRMWVRFAVDYRTPPSLVIATVEKALQAAPAIPGISPQPAANCICLDFASEHRESYALYAVRYWLTNIQDDDPTNSLVRCRIYAALQRANIPLAIPAAHLFIDNENVERKDHKEKKELTKRLTALKSIEFLQVLTPDEYIHLANGLQPVLYAKGENIIVQNEQADWLYIMTQGQAEVWLGVGQQVKKVSNLSAPTFFGEMGLMTGAARNATIVATTDVYCYRLHRQGFKEILQQRPDIAEKISETLAVREVETQSIREKLDQQAHHQRIETRSVDLLSKISDFFGLT
ncbi:MAG: cyclic nucleotide-binding domain-containing protein [Thalassotalea sp.]